MAMSDGTAELYELADHVSFDTELKRVLTGKRLHDLADQWKAERERNIRTDWRKCPDCGMDWPHPSETSSFVCPSCRSAAARAALERARALLPEELTECVGGRGYERCGCANVDKDNHCMYCLYPPWSHDLAQALGGAR